MDDIETTKVPRHGSRAGLSTEAALSPTQISSHALASARTTPKLKQNAQPEDSLDGGSDDIDRLLPSAPASSQSSVPSNTSRGGGPEQEGPSAASEGVDASAENRFDELSEDSKASLRRARNRAAAHKSRAKKSKQISSLEEDMQRARDRRAELSTYAEELKNEVYLLKNEILLHGQCDYPPINQYLMHSVTKVLPGSLQNALLGGTQASGSTGLTPSSTAPYP